MIKEHHDDLNIQRWCDHAAIHGGAKNVDDAQINDDEEALNHRKIIVEMRQKLLRQQQVKERQQREILEAQKAQ